MKKIYNSKLICIKSGSSMKDAKQLMNEKRIRHLPIISENNEILGMLTRHDLTDVEKFQDFPVDLFSTFPIHAVTPETPISTVALFLIENKISSVIVKDNNNHAVGIITTDDLLFEFYKITKSQEEKPEYDLIQGDVERESGDFLSRLRQTIF